MAFNDSASAEYQGTERARSWIVCISRVHEMHLPIAQSGCLHGVCLCAMRYKCGGGSYC